MRESKLTKILFSKFSQSKLSISLLLNIDCSDLPFAVLNLEKEMINSLVPQSTGFLYRNFDRLDFKSSSFKNIGTPEKKDKILEERENRKIIAEESDSRNNSSHKVSKIIDEESESPAKIDLNKEMEMFNLENRNIKKSKMKLPFSAIPANIMTIQVTPNHRLTIREHCSTPNSLVPSGENESKRRIFLVQASNLQTKETVYLKSVQDQKENESELGEISEIHSCISYLGENKPRSKKRKHIRQRECKGNLLEEILRVLDFGNNVKKITSTSISQNPTLFDIKRSKSRVKKRKKLQFKLSKLL